MSLPSFVFVDKARADQFALIGSERLFRSYDIWTDPDGIAWAGLRRNGHHFGVTWMGPGWVFDAHARLRATDSFAKRQAEMAAADPSRHAQKLQQVLRRLRLGSLTERLLWTIHWHVVLRSKASVLRLPDQMLANAVWGTGEWPRHWRQELLRRLEGLSWLHVADDAADDNRPPMGPETALLTYAADLRGNSNDACGEDCPWRDSPRHHHHYLVNIGRGFLGVLEEFAQDAGDGKRDYNFPVGTSRSQGPSLWRTGKTGRLASVFLPVMLGDPAKCAAFTHRQRQLLQTLVREKTLGKKTRPGNVSEAAVIFGGVVPGFDGRKTVKCPLLTEGTGYVGFNGNGRRRGCGYRLLTEGGWAAKAGYDSADIEEFLADLAAVAGPLGLTAIGVDRGPRFVDLPTMRGLASAKIGRRELDRLHLRVYTEADFVDRWTRLFQVEDGTPTLDAQPTVEPTLADLLADLKTKRVSRRALAAGVGMDASFLNKILNGIKRPPEEFLDKARNWLARLRDEKAADVRPPSTGPTVAEPRSPEIVRVALALLARGWSVIPQKTGAKKPLIRWKSYQDRPPTAAKLRKWFSAWPDAGLALVLGPVSGVFVVDVDGPEAHAALVERLGSEPTAPKVLSGSGKPYRYHLFFQMPNLATKATATPWHSKLEFRGKGGIVVIPPSLHKSGLRYAWVPGRSPDDLPLPPVPPEIYDALRPVVQVTSPVPPPSRERQTHLQQIDASPRTLEFLSGRWSEGPGWNAKLFAASCDLCGRQMPKGEAEPLLLAGAQPWSRGEEELARRTIESAYSLLRTPSRL